MSIKDFVRSDDGHVLSWESDGRRVHKTYRGVVQGFVLSNGTEVLIIEPEEFPHNAVIFQADGRFKVRIHNPWADRGAICFSEAGYERGEQVIISRLPGSEIACFVDTHGTILRTQEIR